jgi:hypothetical protein
MTQANPPSLKAPQPASHTLIQFPAKPPTLVATPSGTLSITLTPPPTPTVPLHQNVALWVGLATLVGVVLSLIAAERRTKNELRASENRMRTELAAAVTNASIEREQSREQATLDRRHSAEQAHQERIATARRAVYLEVIDELTRAQAAFGFVTTQEIAQRDDGVPLGGLQAAVSKIGLLGEMTTVILSRELLTSVQLALTKAVPISMQISAQWDSVEYHRQQYDAAQSEVKRLLAAMTNHNEASKDDGLGFKALEAAYERNMAMSARHSADVSAAQAAFFIRRQSYAATLMGEIAPINLKFDELIHAIRTELGLETSLERLRQSTAEIHAVSMAAGEELFAAGERVSQELWSEAGPHPEE